MKIMKKTIVLSIAILFASLLFVNETKAQDSKVVKLTEQTFTTETKTGIVLVDFYADWCRPCKMMKPILEELATSYKGKIVIASVNTEQNKTLARQYNISGIPCMVVLEDGKEVKRIIGYHTKDQMDKELSEFVK